MWEQFNILCVDDEPANLDIVIDILHDYTVYPATNGVDACKVLDKVDIDLILLDIMMPNMTGLDLCKLIKQNPQTNEIPIIFITANHEDKTILNAFEYGGVDFIKKPLNTIDLQQRVKMNLKKKNIFNINSQFYFNKKTMVLYKDKTTVTLSKSEQKLLKFFINNINMHISPIDISN